MSVEAFCIWNFMGFEDSGWIALRPINLLFGRNATGKSALLRALLLLRQSLTSPPSLEPLTLSAEDGVDVGSFRHILHYKTKNSKPKDDKSKQKEKNTVAFGFRCRLRPDLLEGFQSKEKRLQAQASGEPVVSDKEAWATLVLAFGPTRATRRIILRSIEIRAPWLNALGEEIDTLWLNEHGADPGTLIFRAEWLESDVVEGRWHFESDLLKQQHFDPAVGRLWKEVENFGVGAGFLPKLPDLEDRNVGTDEFQGDYEDVRELLDGFRQVISSFLKSLLYLGPVRSEPQRFYYAPGAMSSRAKIQGMDTVDTFLATWGTDQWEKDLARVNSRLEELRLGFQFEVRALDEERQPYQSIFEVVLREDHGGTGASLCDTGFGWSQVLPIVLECVLAEEGATIIIEEPESHLHPSAQATLGDLFIRMAEEGRRFLIETHSENLLLRFRRRLAETSGGLPDAADYPLAKNDFRAYFVDRLEDVSRIEALEFDKWGDFVYRPQRFGDFFGQDFEELVSMKTARRGAK